MTPKARQGGAPTWSLGKPVREKNAGITGVRERRTAIDTTNKSSVIIFEHWSKGFQFWIQPEKKKIFAYFSVHSATFILRF